MGPLRIGGILLLFVLTLSSSCLIEVTNAQPIANPSPPQFTVRYVDYSYDVPPKYGIDQYTGNNVTIQAGYHIENRSIELTVKNQQFIPYSDSSGHTINLYYNFRYKGDYGNTWTYYPENSNGRSVIHYNGGLGNDYEMYPPTYKSSNSDYTVILLSLSLLGPPVGSQEIPNNTNINFEVQTMVGYFTTDNYGYVILTGQSSDWSTTQTVTIGKVSSTSPNPTIAEPPTASPAIPELSWLTVLPLFALTLFVMIKRKHPL